MSENNFSAISQMVTEARHLLDTIKGGAISTMQSQFEAVKQAFSNQSQQALTDFQTAANAKIVAQDQALRDATSEIHNKVTILALTHNQTMGVSTGSVPDHFNVRSGVKMELVETIHNEPGLRTAQQVQLLSEMESGIKVDYPDFTIRKANHYFRPFNVFRVSWDFGEAFDGYEWIFFPTYKGSNHSGNRPYPIVGASTMASFVKLESGSAMGALFNGAKQGQWVFSSLHNTSNGMGAYRHPHPTTTARTGSFLIALPVVATGFIDHPSKLFALPEIG